jgi:hypothetical protein
MEIIEWVRFKESLLSYNPASGLFKRDAWNKKVGELSRTGYTVISVKNKKHYAHRLAWECIHGPIPEGKWIDHINGVKTDNRIVNLRVATVSENLQNQIRPRLDNKLKTLGVHYVTKSRKYIAQIRKPNSKGSMYIGCFNTLEEARDAYIEAKRLLHPFGNL